jgi:hypothetical protein
MQRFILTLREVVWSAVLAVACSVIAIAVAIIWPTAVGLSIAFGSAAITSAILAQRA